jgi:hypothetical protein
LVTGSHTEPVREDLQPGGAPRPEPVTHLHDTSGHEVVLHPDRIEFRAADGFRQALAPGPGGLPVGDLTCLAQSAAADLWLGSRHGIVRCRDGRFELYAGRRWLPDNEVQALALEAAGAVQVWTASGACRLVLRSLSLSAKADHYERLTDARHNRFGYVTGCQLLQPGDLSATVHHIDDNDGLWTAMYLAAQCFRYAVTGSDDARDKARVSLRAMLELERQSTVPGMPARALTHRSETDFGRPRPGEWHPTVDGQWEWKGDTSSDEIDGHYFVWGICWDLLADPGEKVAIQAAVRRVTDHIVSHGFTLVDVDGKPTRWGVWSPERLNQDPDWRAERGLNSLEVLSYLKVAAHITGDEAYEAAYRCLVRDHHYALNTLRQRVVPGDFAGAESNHSDDELAFLAYYNLLRYERDPGLRGIYLASLEHAWRIVRPEACPLWNFIYGALSGQPGDTEAAVAALREIPLDLVHWRMTNSHRLDLETSADPDRFGERQLRRPLPWRERPLHKWNGNPYRLDGGSDTTEECGTFWLLPYWLGRYHGLLAEA